MVGARITSDGSAVSEPFTISAGGFAHSNVSVAGDASGRVLVVYDRTVDVPGVEGLLTRAFLREVDANGPPPRRRAVR